jgi:hypothetical protein
MVLLYSNEHSEKKRELGVGTRVRMRRPWLRPIIAITLLILAALACNRSEAVATRVPSVPTLAPSTPSPTIEPTATPTLAPSPTPPLPSATPSSLPPSTATPSPSPSSTATPVIPAACPPAGNPTPPERPGSFAQYADVLTSYLSAGAGPDQLEHLLKNWGAITEGAGAVRSRDLTGDKEPEIVVNLIDPAPEFDLPWPVGDLLIFKCHAGAQQLAYQGRATADQDMVADLQFKLLQVEDVNTTGRADVVYITSSCGAHTCYDQLYIMEWDGSGFVNRIPAISAHPYATFSITEGQVIVDVGGIGSAGAGLQRVYQEVWQWDGREYVLADEIVGPPTALVHYIHDGDNALARGEYSEAIDHYRAALEDTGLPSGLFWQDEVQSQETIRAYARFKLVVAYAASGNAQEAQSQLDLLGTEYPQGSVGYPYTQMGQAFWREYETSDAPKKACAAAVSIAEADPSLAERLYAGYANPEYTPPDLCRLPE